MAVPEQNMRTLMRWLSDPAITRATTGAEAVTKDLAELIFQGDAEWPNYGDRAARYAETISAWLTGETETDFIALTAGDRDPMSFIEWITPVLGLWHAAATHEEAGEKGLGLVNPNYQADPTPGTQYYKYDEGGGTYLYSETADSADWATYEQRRYSEPTRDDSYGLSYRYDKRDEVYEWHDEQAGTWNSQDWADRYAASRFAAGAAAQAPTAAAVWDGNWQMFYRIGPGGAYEYADAVVSCDESSGPGKVWLSYEQVMMRAAQAAELETGSAPAAPADIEGRQSAPKPTVQPDGQSIQAAVTAVLSDDSELESVAAETGVPVAKLREFARDPVFLQLVMEKTANLTAG